MNEPPAGDEPVGGSIFVHLPGRVKISVGKPVLDRRPLPCIIPRNCKAGVSRNTKTQDAA